MLGSASCSKYLSKIDKFRKRAVRFGYLKEVMRIIKVQKTQIRKFGQGLLALLIVH